MKTVQEKKNKKKNKSTEKRNRTVIVSMQDVRELDFL